MNLKGYKYELSEGSNRKTETEQLGDVTSMNG